MNPCNPLFETPAYIRRVFNQESVSQFWEPS